MDGGTEMTVDEVISEMLSNPLTDGLTLSGGEPFVQAADCARLAAVARQKGLNVWAYSGYEYGELITRAESEPDVKALLEQLDVLVDGRFELARRTLTMKWRGSQNQRFIDVKKSLSAGATVALEM